MNCCICGPVRNCGPYLKKVLQNIEKIGSLFDDYKIIIFYDKSNDNSLQILKEYQKINTRLYLYVNQHRMSAFRTHNIAIARNFCLNFVRNNKEQFPYFIMMDFDDVNCKEVNLELLRKHIKIEPHTNIDININTTINNDDWDALSFNTSPEYYDIWGLSIYPYCFSYNHFEYNVQNYKIIQKYVTALLNKLPQNKLLPCISAFNGFAIYKTHKFLDTHYDGRIRKDLISQQNMNAHMKASNSHLVYKKYVTVDGRYEDCEHRAFHIMARQRSNARIMISPDVVFG